MKIAVNAPVTWVKPELVCNLKYTEATKEGILRHPVFLGLRVDKEAKQVHPETDTLVKTKDVKGTTMKKTTKKIAGDFTNLDKVYWPDEGYTKGDVIEYYNSMYKYISPHLKGKPEVLKRL